MRTLLLVLLTMLLSGGAFLAYARLQPSSPRLRGGAGTAAVAPRDLDPDAPGFNQVRAGVQPWFKIFDKAGRLASRFSADVYRPQPDGTVLATHPVAEFFQYPKPRAGETPRVQRIRIEGRDGVVEVQDVPQAKGTGTFEKGTGGPPKRGRLNDVVIRVFPDAGPRQALTVKANNVAFDNETFEIATESYTDAAGKVVAPDEVAIDVDGDDYAFKGRGLKVRWNDLDGRLELLEVAHGEQLIIKHPTALMNAGPEKEKGDKAQSVAFGIGANEASAYLLAPAGRAGLVSGPSPRRSSHSPLRGEDGAPVLLAAQDKKAAGGAIRKAKGGAAQPPERPAQPAYRATFLDDVRVTQGEVGRSETQLVAADEMHVDFALSQPKPATLPATAPVAAPASRPLPAGLVEAMDRSAVGGASATPERDPTAATRLVTVGAAPADVTPDAPAIPDADAVPTPSLPAAAPTTLPATGPATAPATPAGEASLPVIVRWIGMLRIQPLEPAALATATSMARGDAAVHFVGNRSPVLLTRQPHAVQCAALDYYSGDDSLSIRSSLAHPKVIVTQAGAARAAGESPDGAPTTRPADEAVITTDAIHYSGTDRVAELSGESRARVMLRGEGVERGSASVVRETARIEREAASGEGELLEAQWSRSAKVYFTKLPQGGTTKPAKASGDRGPMTIEYANIEGDVDIQHPQMALRSQALQMIFGPPLATARAASGGTSTRRATEGENPTLLHRVVASESVRCELVDPEGMRQNVNCDRLTLQTAVSPEGKLYPQRINADGNAHAFDQAQDLRAGRVELVLAPKPSTTRPAMSAGEAGGTPPVADATPTTSPATREGGGRPDALASTPVELRTMTAKENVRVRAADGAVATAEALYVVVKDGRPHAMLVGKPDARVADAMDNWVVGPTISIDPADGTARVEGQGSMHVVRQGSPGELPRPVRIAWKRGAELNGPRNRVDVRGPVVVTSLDPDGTLNTATGANVRIDLVDRPPATQPATRPTTAPSPRQGGKAARGAPLAGEIKMDALNGKAVRAIALERDAVIRSEMSDGVGAIEREFELKAGLVRYELLSDDPRRPADKGRLLIPTPGTLLVRDHRAREGEGAKRRAADGNRATTLPAAQDARGAVAFRWQKDMSYNELDNTATLNGDVQVAFRDDAPGAPTARLEADQVVAVFQPKPKGTGAAKPEALKNPPARANGGGAVAQGGQPAVAQPRVADGRPAASKAPPAILPAPDAAGLQLKSLTARGNLRVIRGDDALSAGRIDYDPASEWLTAVGTARNPATFSRGDGGDRVTAEVVQWNTRTWDVKFKNVTSRTQERLLR